MSKIIIRNPKIEDLDSMLEMVNSVIDERAMISLQERQTRASEKRFLKDVIKKIENKEIITKILDEGGVVVGICSVEPCPWLQRHIGEMGIFLKKEARGRGLGRMLFEEVIKEGIKVFKFKILKLLVFSKNKPAIGMYKNAGFKKIATIKGGAIYYGSYEDDDIMVKYL